MGYSTDGAIWCHFVHHQHPKKHRKTMSSPTVLNSKKPTMLRKCGRLPICFTETQSRSWDIHLPKTSEDWEFITLINYEQLIWRFFFLLLLSSWPASIPSSAEVVAPHTTAAATLWRPTVQVPFQGSCRLEHRIDKTFVRVLVASRLVGHVCWECHYRPLETCLGFMFFDVNKMAWNENQKSPKDKWFDFQI